MNPFETNQLLGYARAQDHLVLNTDEALETWATSLVHVPFEAGKHIVREYYGKHSSPDERKPITAAHIRKLYSSKAREIESRQRALEPPKPKRGGGPPDHVRAQFDALFERVGYKRKHPTN